MRIGVDIDGVLTDLSSYLFDYGIDFFYKRGMELVNPKGYEVKGMFDADEKLTYEFWTENLPRYFSMPARNKASEIIKKLQKEGHKIIIITARGSGKDEDTLGKNETQFVTTKWLSMNGIVPDELVFSDNGKLDICLEKNVDLMIDDMPYNLLEVSSKIKCICYLD